MSRIIRNTGAAMIAATLFVLVAFIGAQSASAQSCPGGNLQVQNQTGCGFVVQLDAVPAIPPFFIGPGAFTNIPVAPGTVLKGIISPAGVYYPIPPIPPEPACTAKFRIAAGCCARACFFPHNCILQIVPAAPPCPA